MRYWAFDDAALEAAIAEWTKERLAQGWPEAEAAVHANSIRAFLESRPVVAAKMLVQLQPGRRA